MGNRRKSGATAIAVSAGTMIVLACTCGPLAGLQGVQATVGAAQGTLVAAATEIQQGLPTFEAQLTAAVPTLEAQLTSAAPTLEAVQTQAAQALPTLEAQLTGVAPTVQAGLGGEIRQWASRAHATSQYADPAWSAAQAAGAPDTPQCGDIDSAWASADSTGVDTLTLEYDTPVVPARIEIHQTYNPGAITQVDVTIPGGGVTHIVYQAQPKPVTECPFILVIPISGLDVKVGEVILYLDQSAHPSWNEIDAVELIGTP